jgi:hypothetical protein
MLPQEWLFPWGRSGSERSCKLSILQSHGYVRSRGRAIHGVSRGDRLTMQCFVDESFPGDVFTALRAAGHDVLWIQSDAPGITDRDVRARSWVFKPAEA